MPKESLYTLSRENLRKEDIEKFQEEILRGTDRSSALVAASLVDGSLVRALSVHFIVRDEDDFNELFFDRKAVMSDFASRIVVGRALGIVDDHFRSVLDIIRKVRNAFAHAVRPIDFGHELIAAECVKLPNAPIREGLPHNMNDLRRRYVGVCSNLEVVLTEHAKKNANRQFAIDIWKPEPLPGKSAQPQTPDPQNQGDGQARR